MYRGEFAEKEIFNYILEKYDQNAQLFGGMDSTSPDIVCSLGIVEVKEIPAQCGQFTFNTASNYLYSNEIIEAFGNNIYNNQILKDTELCKRWISNYYKQNKKTSYFGVYNSGQIELLPIDSFFEKYNFICTYREKKSGSRKCPKWMDEPLSQKMDIIREGDRVYAINDDAKGQQFVVENGNKQAIAWINEEKEIRVLSNTKNGTFIFSVN